MAKRRAAEPLTFRVPWKRLLLSDFPEGPPLWVPPAQSRKRQGDAGTMAEPAAAPRKRRGGGDGGQERQLCRGLEPGEPPPGEQEEPRGSRAPGDGMGSAGSGADGAPVQVGPPRTSPEPDPSLWMSGPFEGLDQMPSEDFWQYNTFQYWRNPLPPVDLAALEDVSADSLTETLQDKNEVVEIDMES
ncbi:uncharacterized protein C9orf40 homolog isoform X1 [Chionomys nivalis]|uniref:uncharacterized protein C9orf40 homolog isoform X1 n=1 Tax=Chionomys nivalis TaxID=269649 RepID=UPI002599740E|nr:uncharacterized protein C9orf40 homolog isoform X1 [Chionomys nivalis]